jgi:hypothetical protein
MSETFETILSIAKWSEETFGDNITLEGQLEKFLDERKEWLESDRKDLSELADLTIVASSVARFSLVDAAVCFAHIDAELKLSGFPADDLETAINNKMQINRKRKWGKGKGNFQHIEEGE